MAQMPSGDAGLSGQPSLGKLGFAECQVWEGQAWEQLLPCLGWRSGPCPSHTCACLPRPKPLLSQTQETWSPSCR